MIDPVLILEKSEGIAVLTLNRLQAMNALNRQMDEALWSKKSTSALYRGYLM